MTGGERARSWPPAVALVVGFLLVFLALPNPLRVPSNNPNPTAEIAPVPGQSEDQEGNFSETGLAGSPGLGAGGNTGEGFGIPELPQGRAVPVDKECVGDPPRQTEDPLSPPCVPYFNGDNGGSTYQGVTPHDVKVVLYNALAVEGDMTKPYDPGEDSNNEASYEYVNIIKTIKYQLRYFQRRFQTYGRLVRVVGQSSAGNDPEGQRADAVATQSVHKPFAVVWLGNDAQAYFAKMASFRVPTFGLNEDVPNEFHERYAPYLWSFFPDQETENRWSASFICRKLQPHTLPARFSPDQLMARQPRKLALLYPRIPGRGPSWAQLPRLLQREVGAQCGYTFDMVEAFEGTRDAPRVVAKMKVEGITTVVCYCVPVLGEVHVAAFQNASTAANYFPEWYWDHLSRMDKPIWQQEYGSRNHVSFGSSYYWRVPAFREQVHYQAYVEETRDGSVPNVRWNFNIYHLFLNLFTAIQAAGPVLTPETVERGMFTFHYDNPSYPWLPTGGYGPARHPGTGTYTFIDTGMGWWWDPTGTPPGGKHGEGCQRVIQNGRRFFWDTWEPGDADIRIGTTADPCTEDRQKIKDAQPGDF